LMDLWKISVNTEPNSVANSFNSLEIFSTNPSNSVKYQKTGNRQMLFQCSRKERNI
jgi:hypothetical protein